MYIGVLYTLSGPKYLQHFRYVIKNLHGGIPKPEKTTQAPLVYINAHSCIYNKCLIVISRRDTIERRGSQKR